MLSEKGKTIRTDAEETNGQALVECLPLIPGRRHLCLVGGIQGRWLFELPAPHAHEAAVVRGEKSRGNKSDELDALALGAKIFNWPGPAGWSPETWYRPRTGSRVITAPVVFNRVRVSSAVVANVLESAVWRDPERLGIVTTSCSRYLRAMAVKACTGGWRKRVDGNSAWHGVNEAGQLFRPGIGILFVDPGFDRGYNQGRWPKRPCYRGTNINPARKLQP